MRIDWHDFLTGGGALYLGLALICGGSAVYTLILGSTQDDWAQTAGVVTMARLAPPVEAGKRWRRLFTYEYEVDGRSYLSDRYSLANVGGDRALGINRYDRGDRVVVYYDPRNPSSSVLEKRQPGFFVYLVLLFGLAFLVAAMGRLLARDATALFTLGGIRKLLAGPAERRKESMGDERRDSSLREVEVSIRKGIDMGAFGEDRAVELLHYATELDLEICRELATELVAGRDIGLSARLIRDLSERSKTH